MDLSADHDDEDNSGNSSIIMKERSKVEFYRQNMQLLGFGDTASGLYHAVKEVRRPCFSFPQKDVKWQFVDNAVDACCDKFEKSGFAKRQIITCDVNYLSKSATTFHLTPNYKGKKNTRLFQIKGNKTWTLSLLSIPLCLLFKIVSDTGSGVARDDLRLLFGKFFCSTKCDGDAFGTYGVGVKGVMLYSDETTSCGQLEIQSITETSEYLHDVLLSLRSGDDPQIIKDTQFRTLSPFLFRIRAGNQPANNFQTNWNKNRVRRVLQGMSGTSVSIAVSSFPSLRPFFLSLSLFLRMRFGRPVQNRLREICSRRSLF